MTRTLGIDVGTSGTKAIVLRDDGTIAGTGSASYDVDRPRDGWSEQPPSRWWAGVVDAVRIAIADAAIDGADVGAIGLSGQMHGSVLLDRDALASAGSGEVRALRPALLWNDQRTGAQCEAIERAAGGRRALVEAVGNAALTGFTLPKILWVREHEPEVFARTACIMLPKDYVRLCMTARTATDVGDASGTLLFDVRARAWSGAMMDRVGLDPALFPPALESGAVAGEVTAWAAGALGVRAGIPVVAGSGDNQVGAIGAGVVAPGLVLATLGTSGVVYAHAPEPRVDLGEVGDDAGRLHTMCAADGTASEPGAWCITGCMLSAAGSLQWARDVLAPGVGFDALMDEASAVPAGSEGMVFLPYLTGERCPHPDPKARGAWVGLTSRHTRGHLVRAVLEGVSFGMASMLALVRGLPVEVESVRVGGGGSRSALWRRILADVSGLPVVIMASEEGPALGAAMLAGVGAGVWGSVQEAAGAVVREAGRVEPEGAGVYAEVGEVYAALYPALRPAMHRLSTV